MRPLRPSSHHWLTLAVLLPILLLGALAVLGLRAQEKLAWDEAEKQAQRTARATAALLAVELPRRLVSIPYFPDPPVPGVESPLDEVLDRGDEAALLALRDNPEAGISPAGLPRRVLAALRLLDKDFPPTQKEPLVRLATAEAPSILTGLIFEKLALTDEPVARDWRHLSQARRLLRKHSEGGWISTRDGLWWLKRTDDEFSFINPAAIDAAFSASTVANDPAFETRLSLDSGTRDRNRNPLLLGAAAVGFGDGLRTEVWLRSDGSITGNVRRQQAWTLSLLTLAMIISIGGLLLIQRTLLRERKLNEMKSQFVASVSHELRAPVASIRLMADALEKEKVARETVREFHRLIAREGARLSTLVGNVLDHARIEQGKRRWNMEPCDLAALVADTVRVMEPLAQEKQIQLATSLSAVEATIDAGAIQQALVNLLDNAIKFSPPDTTVTITLETDPTRLFWKLRVNDQGAGVPAKEQTRIFERFYRPGDELRRETQGTGIGLSLVKSIAEAHGGSVRVESENHFGSTFILQIPFAP